MSILSMIMAAAGVSQKGIVGISTTKLSSIAQSISVTCPVGVQVNDLLLLIVSCAGDSRSIYNPPEFYSVFDASSSMHISGRFVTSEDVPGSSSYVSTLSTTDLASAVLIAIRGAAGLIAGNADRGVFGANLVTAPSMPMQYPGILFSVFTENVPSGSCTFSTPSGTSTASDLSGAAVALEVFQKDQAAGSTAPQTSTTSSTSTKRCALQVAVPYA